MKKVVIIVAVIVVLLPVVPKLIPKPLTMESIEAGLKEAGLTVENVQTVPPQLDSIQTRTMTVNGASVELYLFDDEGKIAAQLEYQKPDAGSAIVETWNLAESIGAAKPQNKPVSAARNGKFMMVVVSEDKALRDRVITAFRKL